MKQWEIKNGDYSANILQVGAVLDRFKYKDRDVIVGLKDKDEYLEAKEYFSRVIGPFCNRIRGAAFSLDGKTYHLESNNGRNNLHSGTKNFGYYLWNLESKTDDSITLSLHSEEKGGFPGEHDVEVTYSLSNDGELSITYRLSSDKPCPANITNHAFFNLDGEGTILNHELMIPSSHYLEVDSELIPKEIKSVDNTDFDFRKSIAVGARRGGTYDHAFFLDGGEIVVKGKDLEMRVSTDLPAVQLYTSGNMSCKRISKDGSLFKVHCALCLETEFSPDFPNFPGVSGFYTGHGRVLETTTKYKLIPLK